MLTIAYDDRQERVTETLTGYTGTRVANNIRSRDLSRVLADPAFSDLPVKGQAWDAFLPTLTCVSREAYPEGGGFCLVRLEYATPSGSLSSPATRTPFTEITNQITSVTQLATLTLGASDAEPDDIGPNSESIADGRGTSRDVGYTQLIVHDPVSSFGVFNARLPELVTLSTLQAINRNQITLPRYRQAANAGTFTLEAGQARYHNFTATEPDELGRFWVQHTLLVATDHLVRWTGEVPPGEQPVIQSGPIYPRRTFSNLWSLS